MNLAIILMSQSSSFSECFSAKSYIRGNTLTNELSLHLIPFERITKIVDQNLCQMYLPGKLVVAQIHYDDISFPVSGDSEVNFIYQFNTEIVVTFKLSPTNYLQIINKQNAMYELWYDVNLVKVNNSVNTIEHVKQNGTGCFQKISLSYSIHNDIDIFVTPNKCSVIFSGLDVSLVFQNGNANSQIPIYPCSTGCESDEYQSSSADFSAVKIYRVRRTPAIESVLQDFYTRFTEYRLIPIKLQLKFDTNGVDTVISKEIENKSAKDTWGCKTHDTHLILFSTLNPNNLFVQFRDSLANKMLCDTQNATTVKIDDYLMHESTVYREQRTLPLEVFNEDIGVTFEKTEAYTKMRNNFVMDVTMTIISVSFLDANGFIVYELTTYRNSFIGCVANAHMHIYKHETCLQIRYDEDDQCMIQYLNDFDKNTFGVFYRENGKVHSLGFYIFHYAVNYSILDQRICFKCNEFIADNVYAAPTCQENQELTKQKIKNRNTVVGFGIVSRFESIVLNNIVPEYLGIFTPFVVSASLIGLATITASVWLIISSLK
ncbi:Conserved_hypothetical protein [Hexamita inflata]|uniref:Uncharacterized protein n=1 Tax=Hexamita inflata TaxID=28002 RepID=A0AA86RE70_9EUKA|nr:Conserved hypothetical protein [Hexamita inflata]